MITREEILDIATLSKLFVADSELDELTEQMMEIIQFADTINSFDGEIEEFDSTNNLSNAFREDEVVPSYKREDILLNVGGGENGFFSVKKHAKKAEK